MTDLLIRLFVKAGEDQPGYRIGIGKLAGFTGIFFNSLLFLLKGAAGLLSGSIAIMADALNNLSDAASSVITLLGFHMAQRPADPKHPYGHARFEYISGLAVSFLILLVGFELMESSVGKLIHPTPLTITPVALGILAGSIAVKLWLFLFFRKLGRKIQSATLAATAADSRNDCLTTAGVLVCCLISLVFHLNLDGIVGLVMSVLIFISGIRATGETISPLLGKQADPELIRKLRELVLSHDKLLGVHDVLVHDYGPGHCFASLHAELDASEDPLQCHDLIDDIESDALERLNVHLVIHYDPVLTDDPEWNRMRGQVEAIVKDLDPGFSIHDFRMLRGAERQKLEFDLAIPYGTAMTPDQIKLHIYEALAQQGTAYPLLIRFDFVP